MLIGRRRDVNEVGKAAAAYFVFPSSSAISFWKSSRWRSGSKPMCFFMRAASVKYALDALETDRHGGTPVPAVTLTCVNGAASCRIILAESHESPRAVFSEARATCCGKVFRPCHPADRSISSVFNLCSIRG